VPAKPQPFMSRSAYADDSLSRMASVSRLGDGLACTIWLERRGTTWEVAGLTIHAERDIVQVGPVTDERFDDDERFYYLEPGQTTERLAKEAGDEEPAAVTARVLRDLPIGALVRGLRDGIYKTMEKNSLPGEFEHFLAGGFEGRPGRRGRPDAYYAGIAQHYVRRLQAGSRTPVRDIAEKFDYSVSMVNNWVAEARKRKLLTQAPPGRAGGELTAKATELLAGTGAADGDPEVVQELTEPHLPEPPEAALRLRMRVRQREASDATGRATDPNADTGAQGKS
jgi:transposase-like protein